MTPDSKPPATRPDPLTVTWRDRAARSIEDPFESMLAGLIAPTAAVGFVASGILALAVLS